MRDRRLQRIEAIIEWKQRMASEGDDRGFLPARQYRGADDLRPHRRVMHEGSLAPLGHCLLVEPVLGR